MYKTEKTTDKGICAVFLFPRKDLNCCSNFPICLIFFVEFGPEKSWMRWYVVGFPLFDNTVSRLCHQRFDRHSDNGINILVFIGLVDSPASAILSCVRCNSSFSARFPYISGDGRNSERKLSPLHKQAITDSQSILGLRCDTGSAGNAGLNNELNCRPSLLLTKETVNRVHCARKTF